MKQNFTIRQGALYYPEKRQVRPKLRAFIEHVRYRSADTPRGAATARGSRKLNRANSR
jgi:hypothetical protein